IAAVLALTATGCGGSGTRGQPRSRLEGAVFTVRVSKEAAAASRRKGVDLRELVARSAAKAFSLLPHRGRVDIDVQLDAAQAIPQIGVGGFSDPATGNVSISIDAHPPEGLRKALETWIPASVAHELDHSSRIRTGPGYGVTLAQAMVSEGLADHFAEQAFP